MEKFGVLYTNTLGELICDRIFQLKDDKVVQIMMVAVDNGDGTYTDEMVEEETSFSSFGELENYYSTRTQCVLVFNDYASVEDALGVIGTKNTDFGDLTQQKEPETFELPTDVADIDDETNID